MPHTKIVQKRIPGLSRIWAAGGLHPRVEKWVRGQQDLFKCSRSLIVSNCVTAIFEQVQKESIEEQTKVAMTRLRKVTKLKIVRRRAS
jgi:hypothetical protein